MSALSSKRPVRCAIYTRKSSEEGLQQEFNSLDAQREACQAYIRSQEPEGWLCLRERYDDGGFTGGNMDRPALQRLLSAIATGLVDCVVVYKVDRLSRSLLDFANMMATLDKHQVAFVAVTQQLNTGTSMGRLILNVLLSFAQFERELVSERTRDKIAATRRKGQWCGGAPILGYDVKDMKLVINEAEAERVRAMFALYLELQALRLVVAELERRDWRNKRWRTRGGQERGGNPFSKTSLQLLLTNVLYVGRTKYRQEVHPGQQPAIVDEKTWHQVQELLRTQRRCAELRQRSGALLKGLLFCRHCGRAMTPAHSTGKGQRRYRYYVCTGAQKRGWHTCGNPSVPAAVMEQVVCEQLVQLGHEEPTVQALLGPTWSTRQPCEQARLLRLVLTRLDYYGGSNGEGKLAIRLQPDAFERLAKELSGEPL
jgi:site-specific DNA recombinase